MPPAGIEPASQASEARTLSIVLWGLFSISKKIIILLTNATQADNFQ